MSISHTSFFLSGSQRRFVLLISGLESRRNTLFRSGHSQPHEAFFLVKAKRQADNRPFITNTFEDCTDDTKLNIVTKNVEIPEAK